MKTDPSIPHSNEVEAEIVPARRIGVSWAWLFPIIALLATSWLFWNNWKSRGPEITIHFETAPGIEPGKTMLIHRGVKAGVVESVRLDETLGEVIVSVRLKSFAADLAKENTDFWIELPVISLREISGLESIIQGNSIHARARGGKVVAKSFRGLAEAPLAPLVSSALALNLHSAAIPFIGRGTPVFHRGIKVGLLRSKDFDANGQPEAQIVIGEKYASMVRSNTRFWVVPATLLSASPGTVNFSIPALEGVLNGSIAFDHFGPEGSPATSGQAFELSLNEIAARAEGPPICITFEDGSGLRAGSTQLTCLGKPVGLVEKVTANPQTQRVEVVARLEAAFAPLVTEDSLFTLVRPNLSRKGFDGMDTLVTGPRIDFSPGGSKVSSAQFAGRELPQFQWEPTAEAPGDFRVVLWADSLPQLEAGAPVYHHGMIAGRVIESRMGENHRAELVVTVGGKFREFLRANSRFWQVPAALLTVGPGVVGVEMQGLSALWQGGVEFGTFGPPGPVMAGTEAFELHPNQSSAAAISDPIRILFRDGQGLLAGKTELRYLGLPVGIVEAVRATSEQVEVTARFQPGYEFLTRRGSEFALVRPEVGLQGVKGIETLIGGIYITCAPGGGAGYAKTFHAVPAIMPLHLNEPAIEVVLESPATRIGVGAPIAYNDATVGEVIEKSLSKDGKRISLKARIRLQYANLVRSNSVFWSDSRAQAKIGFFKVEVDRPTVIDPNGRISFHTPDEGGIAAKQGTVFPLLSESPSTFPSASSSKSAPKAPSFRRK